MIEHVSLRAARPRLAILAATVMLLAATAAYAATSASTAPASAAPAAPNGGPDAFGYTWAASTEPGGPVFAWIDISATGTLVTGLADDNSALPIALPFPFRYYWTDIQQITIGSNGWIALGTNVSNIASCFPSIPGVGGPGDSYVAPLMGDLIFTGVGNPGTALYLIDTGAQRVVVSFLNVPWWTASAPGWTGSNTFQLILDAPTRSIKFQYQGLSAAQLNAGCVDLVGGIESPQGNYGLQLFNDVLPPGNRAVEFTYPNPPLISVIDPTPSGLLNASSGGAFVLDSQPLTLTTTVTNDGDAATTSAVSVQGRVITSGGTTIYDQTVLVPSLAGGAQAPISFSPTITLAAGHYTYRVDVSGGGDINAGNNTRQTEIVAVPANQTTFLDYVGNQASNASLDWNGPPILTDTEGAGMLVVPPAPGYTVTALGTLISSNMSTTYDLKLIDNDGPGGLPGTVLGEVSVTPAQTVVGAWADYPITAAPVDADGFYVFWIDHGTAFIGTTTTGPFSRRSLELLSGAYATWRSNEIQDLFLRVTVSADGVFDDGFEDP